MKKILFLILANIFAGNLLAQSIHSTNNAPLYKGYVGLAAGPAFPIGDIDDIGVQFKFELGRLTRDHFGLGLKAFGTYLPENDLKLAAGGLLVGLLFTTLSDNSKMELNFKPVIGLGIGREPYSVSDRDMWNTISPGNKTVFGFAAGFDITVKWNVSDRMAISTGLDFIYNKPGKYNLSSLAMMIGISHRLW